MNLAYNCVSQLNIMNNKNDTYEASLLELLNTCDTSIGKRYFKYKMLNPITDKNELQRSYDTIELFINSNYNDKLKKILIQIYDLERLVRKLCMNKMNVNDLLNLYTSITNTLLIYENIDNNIINTLFQCKMTLLTDHIKSFMKLFEDTFDVEELKKTNNIIIDYKIFKRGVSSVLDKEVVILDKSYEYINCIVNQLNTLARDSFFKIEFNDRDGHYVSCTEKRFTFLKKTHHTNIIINSLSYKKISQTSSSIKFTMTISHNIVISLQNVR